MSIFKSLFGGKNKETITPQDAIQKLSEVQEMLMKKSAFLEKKIDGELATAKKNGTKNKRDHACALHTNRKIPNYTQYDPHFGGLSIQSNSTNA
ncbi:charged multivesicular body protein 4c-like [Pecten maximus]|uniref:charged multivesicular body protein 4c-like n=1 Tax=Pecten maximus TaxID=6579 RepID=UPI0014581242|nr:charged multivesicular body protein 4c-like [Pecten maximus]